MGTAFTRLVGCTAAVQLAPMGSVGTVALAAAVARAGGLGMVPMRGDLPVSARLERVAAEAGPGTAVGVGVLLPFLDLEVVEAVAPLARVVDAAFGPIDPDVVGIAHDAGALVAWQVGSADAARAAVDGGADLIVAQGHEAGGHLSGERPLLALLEEVRAAVEVPVVAAGGIVDAADVRAVADLGADAVRVGTRFVVTEESGAHPDYVDALVDAGPDATVVTTAFGVGWPDAPHRVLRRAVEAAEAFPGELLGEVVRPGGTVPVPRFGVSPPDRSTAGMIEAMALYAGAGVERVHAVEPAWVVVRDLASGFD